MFSQALEEYKATMMPAVKIEAGDMSEWQAEAVRRWGTALQRASDRDWEAFVMSRTATPTPFLPSPYALLQERYCWDGWHLLIACAVSKKEKRRKEKKRKEKKKKKKRKRIEKKEY